MKKSLSLLVAIAMVFSMFATVVSANEKSAGQTLQDLGVIQGTSTGLDEDKEWLRQDITVLIARLLGAEEEAKAHANTHGFEDLDSKFYNGFVSWAKEKGYFTGETTTRFGVGNPITNQQFAAVLLRVLGADKDVAYADVFEKAVELGLVSKDLDKAANAIRGDIYSSLVTALDYKIDGKKLGTILGLKGYEITDVAVVGAKATNSKTIEVEFNQEISDVVASNFSVSKKANESVEVISQVSTSGSTATLTLVDSLSQNTEYVVTASGVVSKDANVALGDDVTAEVTYVATAPVSVSIPTTTVAYEDEVKYVITDANGNDITVDVDEANITVNTTDDNVVAVEGAKLVAQDLSGTSKTTNYAVVQVEVVIDDEEDAKIATPATVITVQPSVAVVSGISNVTFGEVEKDAETSLFVNEGSKQLNVKVVDGNGDAVDAELTYKSANPTVLVVDQDGLASPVKAGSATVVVTAKFNGKTVTKSTVITVKAEAELSSIELSKSSAKLVYGLDEAITETVKLTLKDQFNDEFKAEDQEVKVKANKKELVTVNGNAFAANNTDVVIGSIQDAKTMDLKIAVADDVDAANSLTLTVTVGKFKKTISVSIVKANALAGYVAEITETKIDANPTDDDHQLDATSAKISVYAKDTNGNKIEELDADEFELEFSEDNKYVVVDTITDEGKKVQIKPAANAKPGKEKVKVTVSSLRVAEFTVEVVDTTPALTKVTQVKNAVTVETAYINEALFGNNEKGAAFVGYNQYGEKVLIEEEADKVSIDFFSNNKNVVANDGSTGEAGTALVTVVIEINDVVHTYTITVVVK